MLHLVVLAVSLLVPAAEHILISAALLNVGTLRALFALCAVLMEVVRSSELLSAL
jgi:hypothetical protein